MEQVANQAFSAFLWDLAWAVAIKTMGSFGQNVETFVVGIFVALCGAVGVWWPSLWPWIRRREGAVSPLSRQGIRTTVRAAAAGCIPLVAIFVVNGFRVAYEREQALHAELIDVRDELANVDKEDPGHADMAQELDAAKARIAELERDINERQSLLNDRQARQELVTASTKFTETGALLRQACSKMDPKEFESKGNSWLVAGMQILQAAGRANDARRLGAGEPPPGMPTLAPARCAPQSANNAAAYGITYRLVIAGDIIRGLQR